MRKIVCVLLLGIAFVSCNNIKTSNNIQPSGEIITDTVHIKHFTDLINNSSASIELDAAINEGEIIITGDKNFIENLDIKNSGKELKIAYKKNVLFNTKKSSLVIKMNNPSLQKVVIAGSSSIFTNNVKLTNNMEFRISGSGEINTELANNQAKIDLFGSGKIKLYGTCDKIDGRISGSGKLDAADLTNKYTDIDIFGSGSAKINTSEIINAKISGSGKLDASDLVNKQTDIDILGSGKAKINTSEHINATISGSGKLEYKDYEQLKVTKKVLGSGKIKSY